MTKIKKKEPGFGPYLKLVQMRPMVSAKCVKYANKNNKKVAKDTYPINQIGTTVFSPLPIPIVHLLLTSKN